MTRADIARRGGGLRKGLPVVLAALCLAGCTVAPQRPELEALRPTFSEQELREKSMTQAWVGRSSAELRDAWGAPASQLDLPGARRPATRLLLYIGRPDAGGCIDAFVVMGDQAQTIWAYVCR